MFVINIHLYPTSMCVGLNIFEKSAHAHMNKYIFVCLGGAPIKMVKKNSNARVTVKR